MKKNLFIIFFVISCAAGFSESLPLERMGTPFRRANLEVHWNAPANALPSRVWGYRIVPMKFPSTVISNLMRVGSFTDKDKIKDDANGIFFKSPDNSRTLEMDSSGTILYEAKYNYGPTNLAKDVPQMKRMPMLTTNFLPKLGISISEITTKTNGQPALSFWEPLEWYFANHTFITNIEFRAVSFRRSLNGFDFVANDCEIRFGEYGKVSKISLSWPKVERDKSFATATPATIIRWMRNGRAVQGRIPMNSPGIYWPMVKSVTVKKAEVCYLGTNDYAYPIVALWTTVDTGYSKIDVEIDCPIIDESKN